MASTLAQILFHTPPWVFALFLALLVSGLLQLRPREAGLLRISLMPVAMAALAVYGVASAFPSHAMTLLAWAICALLSMALLLRRPPPAGVRFDAAMRRFHLPGSAAPLALMMGVFFTKYAAGVLFARAPALAAHTAWALSFSAVYGIFSGLFISRAMRLWRLAAAEPPAQSSAA